MRFDISEVYDQLYRFCYFRLRNKEVAHEEPLFMRQLVFYSIFFSSGSTIRSIVVIHAVPPMTLEMGSAMNTPSAPR